MIAAPIRRLPAPAPRPWKNSASRPPPICEGAAYHHRVLAHPYAFNLFSHDTRVDPETGYNEEETKVMRELRKIMDEPDLRISVTCVRVPVLRAHSIALTVEFERPVAPDEAREVLAAAPGVRMVDDVAGNHFPMPVDAQGRTKCWWAASGAMSSDPVRVLAGIVRGRRSVAEGRGVECGADRGATAGVE